MSTENVNGNGRHRLPDTRKSRTVRFEIGGVDCYLTAGEYSDGSLGELFVKLGSKGDLVQGLLDAWAMVFSIAVQHGADVDEMVRKHVGMRFEPMGRTDDPGVPDASSLLDYCARWIADHYGSEKLRDELRKSVLI